jgi:aspartate racemase
LGEIEAALTQHAGVREAIVMASEDVADQKRLIAYVVSEDKALSPSVNDLRGFIKQRLPEYMIPAAFVVLTELPLTANGKVDRKALPAPEQLDSGLMYVAPRTPSEEIVAGIWARVLRVDRVSVHDNFFELGGHSLLATKVMTQVQEALQQDIPLRVLFEKPTVSELVEHIELELCEKQGANVPRLVRLPRDRRIPLSFAQQRLWFIDQLQPGNALYNIPAAVRLRGPLDVSALERSISEIMRRHEVLRTAFVETEGQPAQVISPVHPFLMRVIDLSSLDESARQATAQRLATEEARRPFDLARGPLVRATLLRLSEKEHAALFTLHHIIADAWSMELMVREVVQLYDAFAQGDPSPLPELTIQYADYAAWQRDWLAGEVLEAKLNYWRKQLAGAPPVLELPAQNTRPARQGFRGATEIIYLPKDLSEELKALSQREGATQFMTLLAAFKTLIYRYTAQDDISIGAPIAGRTRAGIESLIGFFVNTLVLRTRFNHGPSFRELLRLVRGVALDAYAHQDVPFEMLVDELHPARSLSYTPLFQAMFTFSPLPPPPVNISLEVAALPSDGGDQHVMAKFDLVLAVAETERGLIARFVYNADLFDAEAMADVAARFEILLDSIVHNPDLALDALSLTPNGKSDLLEMSVVRQKRATRSAELAANSPATSRSDKAKIVATQRAELAARRSRLSASQKELLKRRLKPEAADSPQAETIPMRSERESARLSFSQLRLWLLDQLEPGNPLYNMPIALRLKGQLDLVALERTINEVFRRHEILRTVFTITAAEPVQVIKPFSSARLPLIDVSDRSEHARDAELRRLMADEALHPFDLAAGPLMRVTLVQLEAADYVALLTMHHIISDGWSMNVLTREISALYQAFCSGRPSPLAELPIQYADFAAWQRERLQGEVLANQLAYWKHHLTGAPPVLELPTDHVRPTVRNMQGALQMFSVPAELTRGLREVAQVGEATLFMTLLAAFEVLLSRYTGQRDVVVGTPVAGRTRAELEPLIGFFVNTLVLRMQVEPGLSFMQLQERMREVCLGAYEHQDVPFEMLVEELQPERSLSHSPLFQVMFMLQNAPSGGPLSGGEAGRPAPTLELEGMEVHRGTAKFDLLLSLSESGETLQGAFEYSTELFEEQTVSRMVEHLLVLLGAVVTGSRRPLSVLPLLTRGETQQLLTEYNAATTEYPRHLAVHELFEQQVAHSPHTVALVFQNQQLTYGELNARANQLAHRLVELGVGPESKVGIMVERSIEMVVGLLGILKAGGAYVPLDASSTRERVAFMLDDARIEVLLTQRAELDKLMRPPRHILLLDTCGVELADRSTRNLPTRVTAQNLVYVIYTSGSTGEPKGVEVVQRAVVRLVKQTNYVRLDADEVLLQLAPLAFDASTFEVWGALLNGGRLVIMNGAAATLQEIGAAVEHYGVTTLWLTTGLFHLMVNEELERLRGVRQLLAGGEVLSVEHVERARRELVQCRLTNGYGPTENTTFTCCYEVVDDGLARRSVPIGRAIANTQVYVLGEEMEVVPVGVAGELYTGGDGLARGYLDRPSLTAEKFVPHPFSAVPGARLYRTGDIVRYLEDANIEFIGRRDHQVKLRGFRIELGEVEAALETHSSVQQAVVVVSEESGDKQLVAYVVDGAGEGGVDIADLRKYVRERLPEYMLPASFVLLESLPLKPNGKVDRRKLPALEKSHGEIRPTHVAPRDRLELELTRIWEETLRTQPIGVRDNFFELGGHSLTAVRMFAAIEKRLNKRLPLMTLFHHPTIEHLGEIIRGQEQSALWSAVVCMQAGGTKPRFFCVHPGGGGVFRYVDLVRRLGPDYPFYAFQAAGLEEGQLPETRIEDMAARYIEAMRTVQPEGPYFIGGWSMGGIIALEMSRQLQVLSDEVALLVLMDSALPLARTRRRPVADNGAAQLGSFALDLGVSWNRTSPSLEELLLLPIEGKLALLLEHARAADKVSRDMKFSDFKRLWEVYRANAMAQVDYVPQMVSCKITVLKAGEHSTSSQSESRLGWDKLSAAGADVYLMPGTHYTMMSEPHVQQLAERLGECIGPAITEQTANVL